MIDGNVIVADVSQVNMVADIKDKVVDSGVTRHICGNKSAFTSYTPIGEGEEIVYMGDSRPTHVLRKGKVLLKLRSGKVLTYL